MNAKDLFTAAGEVGADLIDDAAEAPAKRRLLAPRYIAALAACAMLALALAQYRGEERGAAEPEPTGAAAVTESPEAAPGAEGVYIPPVELPEVPEGAGIAMDMTAFVIYGGLIYESSGRAASSGELVGEYLFTSTGGIDEWTDEDGYTEGAGSVAGDVYTVNGYDSDFRLCIPYDDGVTVELFDCLNGVTLATGEDLYGGRLHLRENWTAVEYQTDSDWNDAAGNYRAAGLTERQIEDFIDALCAGEFEYWGADGENGDIFALNLEQRHIYFRMADGTTVELRLFENGLVKYDALPCRALVNAAGEAFDAVWDAAG